jgi:hypothetical protein
VAVSNSDDDAAGISVSPLAGLVTSEAGGTASFTVVLNSQPTADVTIPVASNGTKEGTLSISALTFHGHELERAPDRDGHGRG